MKGKLREIYEGC